VKAVLYPGECYIILDGDSPYQRLEYCKDDSFYGWGREYFYVTDEYVLPLIDLFRKYYALLYKLTDILMRDLAGLRGTHACKNRTIARLKKFVRILGEIGGGYELYHVSLYTLFRDKIDDLKEMIEALETVRNEYHRVRDPVHELFYPHIREILEDLREIRIVFPVHEGSNSKLRYEIEFRDKEIRVERRLDTRNHGSWTKSSIEEIKEIVEKRAERRKRRARQRRLMNMYWEFINGEQFWDPQDDILCSINKFFEVIQ